MRILRCQTLLGAQLYTLPHTGHEMEKGFVQGLINGKVGSLSQGFWLQAPWSFLLIIFIFEFDIFVWKSRVLKRIILE